MSIATDEWIALIRREYLDEFISGGGSAVKIAVVPTEDSDLVQNALAESAADAGCQVIRVSAADVRIHMIHVLFHAVARQIDWDAAIERWLRAQCRENGIEIRDDQSFADMDAIAAANGRPKPQLFSELNRLITNGIIKDYGMSKEFRTALAMMCLGCVNPQNVSPSDADVIKQWLYGEPCNLTALKRMQIYQKVGRHNARLLLHSLVAWLRKVGVPGVVLLLDIQAVVAPTSKPDAAVRYTRNTILDTFEILRQFIDDIDDTAYLLTIVFAGPGLIDDPKRNLDNYTALKMRVWDDVRDRDRSNPLNAMVRLSADDKERFAA